MEIEITRYMQNAKHCELSASVAELGKDAAQITWNNAKREAESTILLTTDDALDAFRRWIREFGDWDVEEIAAWSPTECNALLIQYISGNIRELESVCYSDDDPINVDWDKAESLARDGTIAGNIYRGDDGRVWFYMGS